MPESPLPFYLILYDGKESELQMEIVYYAIYLGVFEGLSSRIIKTKLRDPTESKLSRSI
jgi:hypothetical protein